MMIDNNQSKHPGGRPLKFTNVEELQKQIDAYFSSCDSHVEDVTEWVQARDSQGKLKKDKNGLNYLIEVTHKVYTEQIPYTVTGLALALGTNRSTLVNYEARDEFFDTIKRAKTKIEDFAEQRLYGSNPTGTIFNLKNNYGWKDKTETDITTGGEKIKTALVEFVGDESGKDKSTDSN